MTTGSDVNQPRRDKSRRTSAAQQAQWQFQANLLDQLSAAVIAVDLDERITYLNRAAVAQYRVDPVSAIGRPLSYAYRYEWLQPEDELLADAALAQQGQWQGENRHIRQDGSTLQVEALVTVLRNAAGNATGLLATIRDITDRKQAEHNLRTSELRYRRLADTMPQLVWTADATGVVDYYNIHIHDFDPSVWQGATGFDWESLLHPEDRGPTLAAWQQAVRQRQPYSCEQRLHMADGSWRWHLSRAVLLQDPDQGLKWYGTATDIHDRKLAEDALRANEVQLQTILQNIPVSVYMLTPDQRYLYVNRHYEQLAGITNAEIRNKALADLFDPATAAALAANDQRALAARAPIALEEFAPQDGVIHTYASIKAPLLNAAGEPYALLGISTDITEHKQAEDALRASEERLRLATEAGGIGIFDYDATTNQATISPIYAHITGLPHTGAVTREAWLALLHPEDRTIVEAIWREALATSASYYYECRLIRPDGVLIWVEVNAWITTDDAGRGVRITGAVRDITERKQTALHQQFLLDLNSALRTLTDADTIQQTVVERLGEYLGADRCRFNAVDLAADKSTLLAAWSRPGLPPPGDINPLSTLASAAYIASAQAGHTLAIQDTNQDERNEIAKALLLAHGFAATIRVPCLREGQWVASLHVLQATPRQWRPDEVQLVERVVHHFWPLVEKARAEEARRQSEERLRLALAAARMATFEFNVLTQTVQRSPQALALQGLGEYGVAGEYFAHVHLADREQLRRTMAALTPTTDSYELEYRFIRPDTGATLWLLDRARAFFDEQGRLLRISGLVLDVTERKAVEADRQLLTELAEQIRLADNAADLVAAAVRLVGDHLQGGRCLWIELDERQAQGFIHAQHCRDLPPVATEYAQTDYSPTTRAELAAGHVLVNHDAQADPRTAAFYETVYAPQQERAYVGVPLLHEGIWRGLLAITVPEARQWQPREIHLLETVTERVWLAVEKLRLHAEVQRMNERFTLAEAAVSGWIYDYDWRTGTVMRSDGFQRVLGYTPEECQPTAAWWQSLIHPDDWQWLAEETGPHTPPGDLRLLEYRVRDRNGHYHHIWDRARIIRDEIGAVIRLVGSSVDITEQKQTEAALQQSNAILRGVLESSNDAIFVRDLNGRYLLVNNAGAEQVGLPKAAMIGRRYQEIFDAAAVAAITDDERPVLTQGLTVAVEHVSEQKGIMRYWHTLKMPLRNADGALIGLISSARDFTERKTSEVALRASEARFRHLAEAMPQVVWTSAADGTTTYINSQWLNYSGMSLPETLVQGMWPAIHPADQALNREQWRQALTSGTAYEGEVRYCRRDGVYRWFLERAIPVRDETGVIQQWFGVSVDIHDRKEAEQRQAELVALLEAMLANAPVGFAFLDREQRFVRINQVLADQHGRPIADHIGRTFAEIAPHTVKDIDPILAQVFTTGAGIYNREISGPKAANPAEIVHTLDSWFPVAVNGVTHYVGTMVVDITERKRQERHQQFLNELGMDLRLLSDSETILTQLVNRLGEYLRVAGCRVNEVDRQRAQFILQKDWVAADAPWAAVTTPGVYPLTELAPPNLLAALQAAQTVVVTNTLYDPRTRSVADNYENERVHSLIGVPIFRQGEWRATLSVKGHGERHWRPDEVALLESVAGQLSALLEKVRAEEIARQQLAEIEAIYATAPVGLCLMDRTLRYVRVNEMLATMNHHAVADLLGRPLRETEPEAGFHLVAPLYRQVIETGEPLLNQEVHENYVDPAQARDWLASYYPLKHADGSVTGVNAVIVEITERKRQERQVQELNRQLRESNATLEARVHERTKALEEAIHALAITNQELAQFTTAAAHDLRTPLRGIANLVQWIREDAAAVLPPASQQHLEKLGGRVSRLEKMLEDLLTYSRVGRVRYLPEVVNVQQLVQNLVELLSPPPGFVVNITTPLPTFSALRIPLELVFRNLLSNAIRHHHDPANGLVTISGRDLDAWYEFCISDNGPGIDPQYHERIFGMFQTLKPRDQVEGSGIGLALVKKTVESVGGCIGMTSALGQGTTFYFTWPKA